MRELDLLAHIHARSTGLSAVFPWVIVGPGDDCAVVSAPPGAPLLLKVDQLVSGRHFRPYPETPIDLIARKAVARAVSDIAAMAGTPRCALASASIPPECAWADDLFDAMARWAVHWRCPLVGGDIAFTAPPPPNTGDGQCLVLSVSILGLPHPTRGPVLRSTARVGDGVYVTGPLGGSFDPATGLGRHLTFEPRLCEAAALADALGPRLHAMMDLSDGLGIDALRLAAASGARIELDAASFPLASGAHGWRAAAGDGEDYELLFTTDVQDGFPCPVFRVGTVREGSGCFIRTSARAWVDAGAFGWEHGRS
jgi:thiamine-monophosphate kinase